MTLLIILLLLALVMGPLPYWPWSRDWGYNPFYVALVVVLIYLLAGYM